MPHCITVCQKAFLYRNCYSTTNIELSLPVLHEKRFTHNVSYSHKMLLGVAVCESEQLQAAVQVCERPDPKAVGRVKLALQELAAGVANVSQLEKMSSWQQHLDRGQQELIRTWLAVEFSRIL